METRTLPRHQLLQPARQSQTRSRTSFLASFIQIESIPKGGAHADRAEGRGGEEQGEFLCIVELHVLGWEHVVEYLLMLCFKAGLIVALLRVVPCILVFL